MWVPECLSCVQGLPIFVRQITKERTEGSKKVIKALTGVEQYQLQYSGTFVAHFTTLELTLATLYV